MSRREGISFQDAVQEAVAEIDSAESDLAPTAVELAPDSDGTELEQPIVESDEQPGLFDRMFVEKQKNESEQLNEDSLTFDVNGERLTIGDLKAGYMRQADYTRKTQELSTLRKDSENAIVLWKSLQEKPQETIRALWSRVAQGQAPAVEPAKADVDIEALVAQRVEEALANDPRVKAVQEQEIMSNIEAKFAEIEGDENLVLNTEDRIRVLERAQELDTPDLKYAFFTLMQEVRRLEAQQRNAAANSSVSGIPTTNEEPITGPKTYRSVREALDDTLRESGLNRETVFVV